MSDGSTRREPVRVLVASDRVVPGALRSSLSAMTDRDEVVVETADPPGSAPAEVREGTHDCAVLAGRLAGLGPDGAGDGSGGSSDGSDGTGDGSGGTGDGPAAPDGGSGPGRLEAVREAGPDLPVVVYPARRPGSVPERVAGRRLTDVLPAPADDPGHGELATRVLAAVGARERVVGRPAGDDGGGPGGAGGRGSGVADRGSGAVAGPDGATGPNEAAGREHYRTVVETVPVGLLLVDERAGIDWFNDRFARLFEEDESELLDLSVPDLIDRGYLEPSLVERYLDGVREMLSDDATADRLVEDVVVHGPDGEDRWFDVHWGLRPTEDGEFRGTVVVFREITDRKTSERALRRQNRRLEQIASFASHDLRNPLTVARGYAERALSAAAPDGEAHAAAEEVVTSLDRMDRLIDQMLTLARGEARPTDVTEVDLAAVAREAWADATGTGGPTGPDDPVVGAPVRADAGDGPVEATLTVEDCVVTGDRSLVRQALVNLFRNAIQHGATTGDPGDRPDGGDGREASDGSGGDQGGEASDGGGEDDGDDQDDGDGEAIPSVSVRVGPLGDGEGFYVADDGPGIQPVERELVFELGYTTTETGTGFGLGIVRQVAEAHGWAVRVTESAAGGARFEVSATG